MPSRDGLFAPLAYEAIAGADPRTGRPPSPGTSDARRRPAASARLFDQRPQLIGKLRYALRVANPHLEQGVEPERGYLGSGGTQRAGTRVRLGQARPA